MIKERYRSENVSSIFEPEDPLLEEIKSRLDANPNVRNCLRPMFTKRIHETLDVTVGLRPADTLAFVSSLANGSIPLKENGEKTYLQNRKHNWFYLTMAPYFAFLEPRLVDGNDMSLYRMAYSSVEHYGRNAAFAGVFKRTIEPVLIPKWRRVARDLLVGFDEDKDEQAMQPELVVNEYIKGLIGEFQAGEQANITVTEMYAGRNSMSFPYVYTLAEMVVPGFSSMDVLRYAYKVFQERRGVLVGFNAAVLKGKLISKVTDRGGVISDPDEIAVTPTNLFLRLSVNPITAIESMGSYEDHVLKELGLVNF